MPKAYSYRELIKALRKHDRRFDVFVNRGKGSERMIYHPDVNGHERSYPIKCHGEGTPIGKGHIAAIRRRFDLPNNVL